MNKRYHITFLLKTIMVSIFLLSLTVCDDSINSSIQKENKAATTESPSLEQPDPDAPEPGNSGIIIINKIATTRIRLFWTAATDQKTDSTQLQYRVYYSLLNNISRPQDMELYGTPATNWITNSTSAEITGLQKDTVYYCNVMIKDSESKTAAYKTVSAKTSDYNYQPLPGNWGNLTIESIFTNSIHLNWEPAQDYESDQENLDYIIYTIGSGTSGYSLSMLETFDSAMLYGTAAIEWTSNINSATLQNLQPGSDYFVNVFVRDEDNDISAYAAAEFSTTTDTSPVPGNSGILIASNIKETSIKIDWTWGTDSETPQNKLRYRVYALQQPSSYTINTFSDAESYGTLFMDWQQNMNSYTLNGLSAASGYSINVFVMDEDGNISAYTPITETTLIASNAFPVPGTSGTIKPAKIDDTSISIEWDYASDIETPVNLLDYRVYTLRLPILTPYPQDLDTFANAMDFGTLHMDWQQNKKKYTINGLISATQYIINVFVRDEFGNISPYTAINATTD